eukprot:CAMPEP_0197519292 /NCGR_PEP_ID=MMETSP1318-20131121/4550_1 /TAXON_ID=552666 /ORGANISM="Partenskyella glossopodia, Strain RCC365" /LENGTH=493 /DNA_ID=CAMNT_0043070173 /DNA_START=393 /DNA_END=1874 /DNA_ORIENTATION=+
MAMENKGKPVHQENYKEKGKMHRLAEENPQAFLELAERFALKETPDAILRKICTPKLRNAFLMLDPEYAKNHGKSKEHEAMLHMGRKIRSGMGHADKGYSMDSNPKAFDLYLRFRESSSHALKSSKSTTQSEPLAQVVAEIDAMSMETVMFNDAHMLETQMQQLSEIKRCFNSNNDMEDDEDTMSVNSSDNTLDYNVKGAKILLAVVHQTSSSLLKRWLVRYSFKVKKTTNGEEALNLLLGSKYDLVICDGDLDEMDGFKLTEAIQKHEKLENLPVIIMSSLKKAEDAYKVGAKDFLSKPVGKNILLKKVGTVLENAFYKNMVRRVAAITGKSANTLDYDPSKVEIMIVDDDLVTRKILNRWLTTNKYKTVMCKTGVHAWKLIREWAKESKTDVTRMILSDVTMPELSGYKLLEWVISDNNTKHIPLILMSAVHTDHGGKERGILGGSQDFLVKPFTKNVLLNKIKTIMETVIAKRNRRFFDILKTDGVRGRA